MNYLNRYYTTILKFLDKKIPFYRYYDEEYSYQDLKLFCLKFLTFIKKKRKKKKLTIATYSNKSFEMYASIFPILLSNSTWVPLSIEYPFERLINICEQVKPDILLFDENIDNKIIQRMQTKIHNCRFIKYEMINNIKLKDKINFDKYVNKISYDNTAFIYFTSGSTGLPKGIKVSHSNIINQVYFQIKSLYNIKKNNLIFGDYYNTAFSIFFDIYFPAIFLGSCLSPSKKKYENFLILDHLNENKINILVCVPSTFERLRLYYKDKLRINLKNLLFTGEPFYLGLLKYVLKVSNSKRIYNCYGGTEMGNWVFYHKCKKNDLISFKNDNLVPIGKPFDGNIVRIEKNSELVVKSKTISNGYLDNKLNSKFIFSKNKNTFYTSDKVIKKGGVYLCKGRIDKMVKISGYRVEISEVEANFYKLKFIRQCVVYLKKKDSYNFILCAAVSLSKKDKRNNETLIRYQLKKYLPPYMIPKRIDIYKSLPLNINGKIDRKRFS